MGQRRSSAELRQLLIDAGLRVLYRTGLRATASHVPMTAAIDDLAATHGVEVGMGSIFGRDRLWANVGEYQIDLLCAAIEDPSSGGPNDQSLALIHEHLDEQRDRPFEERMATMIDLCRVAGALNGHPDRDWSKRRSWDVWVGIWATAMTADDASPVLVPALRREVERTNAAFAALYSVMLDKLGLRIRAPYTMEQLVTLVASLTDGIALRTAIDPGLTEGVRSHYRGHGSGVDDEWNMLGVGLAAIATELLEADGS